MTWVYIESEPGLWTVGFYAPSGAWVSESDHSTAKGAADWVHYLNGGEAFDQQAFMTKLYTPSKEKGT